MVMYVPQGRDSIVPPTEEDAFTQIVKMLQEGRGGNYGYGIYLPYVFDAWLHEARNVDQHQAAYYDHISEPFFAAAWLLCRRGIIRPGVQRYHSQSTDEGSAGSGYSVTPFGKQWLKEAAGKYDYVPTEPGRFAQMLDKFTPTFGSAFKVRAQEAVKCYGAHAHLACCVMCGAAAESIYLAIAIAKTGDQAQIEKDYSNPGGRGKIEKLILDPLGKGLQNEFRGYVGLMKYWRDVSAHGMCTNIEDSEAFTSLAILLRFAQFATDRWNDLTGTP
ncbi:MAG: hypothetical protein JNL96_03295 [Planctomycetaceae bacterium]|nr:hypothetical protein [Planctomycetaceae bacterium]